MFNWKLLRNYSIFLTALLAGVSLLLPGIAGGLSLFLVLIFGALISWKAAEKKLQHAALLPLIPSVLLQLFYFSSIGKYDPGGLIAFIVLFNLGTVVFFGFLGGLLSWCVARRKKAKTLRVEDAKKSSTDQFQKNLQRLVGVIVLASFLLQLFVMPVAAATQVTGDEYIQNYEPNTKIGIGTGTKTEKVKNKVPKEGINNLTPEQLQQYCLETGVAIGLSECTKFAPSTTQEEIIQQNEPNQWAPVLPKIWNSVVSKGNAIRNAIYPPTQKKTLGHHVIGFVMGVLDTAVNLFMAVPKAGYQLAQWSYKNPQQATKVLKGLVNPVWGVTQVVKWTYQNRAAIATKASSIKKLGDTYGWGNVLVAAFASKDAVDAWNKGDKGYAIGRGFSEFAVNVLTFVSPAAVAEVPLIGERLAQTINIVHETTAVISGVRLLETAAKPAAGVLTETMEIIGSSKIGKTLLGEAAHSAPVTDVLHTVVTNIADKNYSSYTTKLQTGDTLASIETRAAKMSAADNATKTTAKEVAQMYESGKSYETSMKYISTGLKSDTITAETATNYISTVSKNKGVQALVSDTARPAVAQAMTEYVSHASPAEVKSLNTLGSGLEKAKQTPVAVKTFADGTSEVLAVSKKGEYTLNYVSADGKLISKAYTPKAEGEEQFVQAFMGEDGTTISSKPESGLKASGHSVTDKTKATVPATYGSSGIPTDPAVALAQDILPLNPNRPLTIDELKQFENVYADAHGTPRHSGRSKAYLKNRALSSPNLRYTSTYFNDNEYTAAVNGLLTTKAADIENWLLHSTDSTKAFEYIKPEGDYGWVYDKIEDRYYKNNVARIILRKNRAGKPYIVSNYVKE